MTSQEAPPAHLCKHFKSLFVTGLRSPEDSGTEPRPAHEMLCSLLYNVSVTNLLEDDFPMKILWNSSKAVEYRTPKRGGWLSGRFCGLETCAVKPEDVEEVQRCIVESVECGDGCTLVIIAHSLGSSVVYEALTEGAWQEYFKKNGTTTPSNNDIRWKIRRHLAVITFGGTRDIPEDMAKLAVNITLKQDHISTMATFWYGTDVFSRKRCYRVIFFEEKVVTRKSKSGRNPAEALMAVSEAPSGYQHKLDKYMQKKVLKYITKCLSLNTRSCKCT